MTKPTRLDWTTVAIWTGLVTHFGGEPVPARSTSSGGLKPVSTSSDPTIAFLLPGTNRSSLEMIRNTDELKQTKTKGN